LRYVKKQICTTPATAKRPGSPAAGQTLKLLPELAGPKVENEPINKAF
jgi:hypothetical protein